MSGSALCSVVGSATMASADFRQPIAVPLDTTITRQVDRPPRVRHVTFTLIPAAYTTVPSVQVSGFEDIRLLTQHDPLVCDFCSSGQCFACGFLQIPPHDGHPCRPANRSPCRAGRGLAPPSHPIRYHSVSDSARHGATRHVWRTKNGLVCQDHKDPDLQNLGQSHRTIQKHSERHR